MHNVEWASLLFRVNTMPVAFECLPHPGTYTRCGGVLKKKKIPCPHVIKWFTDQRRNLHIHLATKSIRLGIGNKDENKKPPQSR